MIGSRTEPSVSLEDLLDHEQKESFNDGTQQSLTQQSRIISF